MEGFTFFKVFYKIQFQPEEENKENIKHELISSISTMTKGGLSVSLWEPFLLNRVAKTNDSCNTITLSEQNSNRLCHWSTYFSWPIRDQIHIYRPMGEHVSSQLTIPVLYYVISEQNSERGEAERISVLNSQFQ